MSKELTARKSTKSPRPTTLPARVEPMETRLLFASISVTNMGPAHDNVGDSTTGWTGFLLTLHADPGDLISAVDYGQTSTSTRGIFGQLLQDWSPSKGGPLASPVGATANDTNGGTNGTDSHILLLNRGPTVADAFEDSDVTQPAGAPTSGAQDIWGTGTYMHGVFGIPGASQANVLPFAYVVLNDSSIGSYEVQMAEAPTNGNQSVVTVTGQFGPPALTVSASAVEEPNVGGTVTETFTATLSDAPVSSPSTVDFATADGTAIAGTDYDPVSGTLTFNPGETQKTIDVTVHGVAGTATAKTFTLNFTNAHKLIPPQPVTATITPPPTVTATPSPLTEPDPGTDAVEAVTLTLSAAPLHTATIDVATADGTAIAGTDYDALPTTTVTFSPGQTTQTVNITVHGVAGTAATKSFALNFSNPNGLIAPASPAMVTIAPQPSLSATTTPVLEPLVGSTAQAIFTLTLSQASTQAAVVDVATADGTAIAGSDYDAVPTTTVTFAPGETSKQVTVTVHGVVGTSADKTFSLNLSNGHGLAIAVPSVTETITAQIPIAFDAKKPLKYTDTAGHNVFVQLIGPGTGSAMFVAGTGDPIQVAVAGTTAASSLIVRSIGGATTLHDVVVQGPLNFITGNANVVGNVSIAGTLRAAVLGNFSGQKTLAIGQGGVNTVLRFGNVSDLSLSTPGTIASLVALSWTDSNATPDTITAQGGINVMNIVGPLGASLSVGSGGLGVGRVVGDVTGGTWDIGGSSRAIVVKSTPSTWVANFAGDLNTFVALGNSAGSLTAHSIRVARIVGSLSGALHTTGTAAELGTAPGLGVLFVGGSINGADVRSVSDITLVSAASVVNSTVFAGVASTTVGLPASAAEFTAPSSILTFVVRGGPALASAFS
ncbi:MAG TPA: Calx-beta domain-containing protein, partial [Tepidisphaeraceae bacterium]|nr:Calx-beta domain-containing protein [Tepidisphaeraceae bacterium]